MAASFTSFTVLHSQFSSIRCYMIRVVDYTSLNNSWINIRLCGSEVVSSPWVHEPEFCICVLFFPTCAIYYPLFACIPRVLHITHSSRLYPTCATYYPLFAFVYFNPESVSLMTKIDRSTRRINVKCYEDATEHFLNTCFISFSHKVGRTAQEWQWDINRLVGLPGGCLTTLCQLQDLFSFELIRW